MTNKQANAVQFLQGVTLATFIDECGKRNVKFASEQEANLAFETAMQAAQANPALLSAGNSGMSQAERIHAKVASVLAPAASAVESGELQKVAADRLRGILA